MAELIDKGVLIELFEEKMFNSEVMCPVVKLAYVLEILEEQPTTTEAEIIEKFAEKLGEAFSEKSSEIKVDGMTFDILTLDSVIEIMWDLTEQLKEE